MRSVLPVAAAGVALLALAGCATTQPSTPENASVSVALALAPSGNPLSTLDNSSYFLASLGFSSLVSLDPKTGEAREEIASEWTESAEGVTFTIRDGVLCSDGSAVTPSVVAKTFNWVLNVDNASPALGAWVPRGATVVADDSTSTLTISTSTPNSFTLSMVSRMPILCGSGADDPNSLATDFTGTGMYELTKFVEGQEYTYALRKGFDWGPDGVSAKDDGVPAEVVARVVSNESTVANMLTTGEVSVGQVAGSDRTRLDASDLFSHVAPSRPGLLFFNQAQGRIGSDADARKAIVQALDLAQLGDIGSAGQGVPLKSITVAEPAVCTSDAVTASAEPEFDEKAAAAGLDALGWTKGADGIRANGGRPLTVKLLYPSTYGPAIGSAAELIQSQLAEVGVTVELTPSDNYASVLFSGGDWDMVWAPLTISLPTDWQGIFTAPAAPAGPNFASVENPDYVKLAEEANAMTGADSCQAWETAEESLLKNLDVVPITGNTTAFYGAGVTFDVTGSSVDGSSIRVKN